jgi:hypothetical protein
MGAAPAGQRRLALGNGRPMIWPTFDMAPNRLTARPS